MAEGYRAEIAERARSEEQRRSALVQALLEGRLDDTNLWEAADVLSLPQSGPYVVIAARVPEIGEHALPQIQRGLHGMGIDSAWRLMHDVEIGVARLPRPGDPFDRLVAALDAGAAGRVGVSPPYDDLRATSQALRLARIALHGALDRHRVVVFGRDPLSVAAASAPDIMPRLSRTVLAALDGLPPDDRALLLDTFGAWLDSGGSAEQTARELFVHPNTVRYRLRRLEERTGRSLSDPRWVAELSLAYEIDRRLTASRPAGPAGGPAAAPQPEPPPSPAGDA
jgi:sugar diacid utilization regulator